MEITPLGIGACFCYADYGYTCNVIDRKLLLDAGPQVEIALRKARIEANSLEALLISHFHPDHILGFPMLIPARASDKPLPVIGPKGLKKLLVEICNLSDRGHKLDRVQFIELEAGAQEQKIGDYTIKALNINHAAESLGYLISNVDGFTAGVSADAGWSERLGELIAKSDAAVIEMTFIDDGDGTHLYLNEDLPKILEVLPDASRLYLTHLGSPVEEYHAALNILGRKLPKRLAEKLQRVTFLQEFQPVQMNS